jgi:antitoxin HicB
MPEPQSPGMNEAALGGSFDDFLRQEDLYEASQAGAIKRVLAWQLAEEMKRQSITKVEMARRMKTSRSQLDRLLDPDNDKVELATLARAAKAVGRELRVGLG